MPGIELPLLERERELEGLTRVIDAARRGSGGAALIEGPPGIGKSRLLAAAAAAADDLEVARARACELEHDFPFGVVRQLFEPVLFAAAAPERDRLLTGAAGLAARALASTTGDGEAADAFATLHGLYWFAANLSAARPLLLLVDDAQWCDADSLRWLVFLVRRLEGLPVALILGVRAGETGADEALLDELVGDPSVSALRPAVLSDAGVAKLTEQALGAAPQAEFVRACQLATGGNPFLLRELLGELADRGVDATADGARFVARLSASGVGRAVRSRIRRLPDGCVELARAVSVLGDGCELTVAARTAELDERVATRAAHALADASVLENSRPLAFVHPLVRSSVYGELGAGDRSTWHRRAAAALAEARVEADRIALHLLACDPAGDADAAHVLQSAAESARRRDAHDVAATYLRRALQERLEPAVEARLTHELGSAELKAGEIDAAIGHLTAALGRTAEPAPRALVATELARGLLFSHRAPAAVDVLTEAIDELRDVDESAAARLVALRAAASLTSTDALRRARVLPEPRFNIGTAPTIGERLVLGPQAFRTTLTGTAGAARSLALRALGDGELLAATGAHDPIFYAPLAALIWSHSFRDAERHVEAALQDAHKRGSQVGFATASHFRAALRWEQGMLAELEADARAALASTIVMIAFPLGAVVLAEGLVERGDPEAAGSELEAAGLAAGVHEAFCGNLVPLVHAHVELARQRPEAALGLLLECGRHERAWGIATPSMTNWRAQAAVLLARGGEQVEAQRLAGEAVRRAEAFGSPVARGSALRAAAVVARPPDHDRLAASVDLLRDSGAQLELARSLIDLGAALRRSGRRQAARERLREGLETAVACGAAALARGAHEELVAAGARPRRDPIKSRSALTASEQRVAGKAADGMTNREIAQALFLTEKTVEVHLTRAYRKLDIRSRSQLADALLASATA